MGDAAFLTDVADARRTACLSDLCLSGGGGLAVQKAHFHGLDCNILKRFKYYIVSFLKYFTFNKTIKSD